MQPRLVLRAARLGAPGAVLAVVGFFAMRTTAAAWLWQCPWTNGLTFSISCGYHCLKHTGDAAYGLDFNRGSGDDDCGEWVRAVMYGEVRRSACSGKKSESGYGCHVEILHGTAQGPRSFYAHLRQQPFVAIGQDVCQGQLIGLIGKTGGGAGPTCHLHFHMRTNGGRDPLVPEPMFAKRNSGTVCQYNYSLGSGVSLTSCTQYDCPH
jgi:hypothetical protein